MPRRSNTSNRCRRAQIPNFLTLHPDGKRLYIANEDDNLVTVVDINTGQVITEIPVGVEPEGMGMSPDGKVLVNTSETTNMAHFIDTTQHKTFDNVLVDSRPRVAMFNAAQTQLWVSSEVGGTVTVINPADRKIITKIHFEIPGITQEAIQPVGIRITRTTRSRSSHSVRRTAWRSSIRRRSRS